MVTVEKYISTFVKVIPQRATKLRLLINQKEIIDENILKTGTLDINQKAKLLELIGDGKTPNTIRGALWKIEKSLLFFLDKKENIIDRIYKETAKIRETSEDNPNAGLTFYSDMINLRGRAEQVVTQILPNINELNYIYKSEVVILGQEGRNQKAYADSYIELLKKEQEQAKNIKNNSKALVQLQRSLQGFIMKLLNAEDQTILAGTAISAIGLTLFASVIAIPMMMYGMEAVKDATPLIPRLLAMTGGFIGTITSMGTFLKFLGESA